MSTYDLALSPKAEVQMSQGPTRVTRTQEGGALHLYLYGRDLGRHKINTSVSLSSQSTAINNSTQNLFLNKQKLALFKEHYYNTFFNKISSHGVPGCLSQTSDFGQVMILGS